MHTDFLTAVFEEHADDEAFAFRGDGFSYRWLIDRISLFHRQLDQQSIGAGSVVLLHGEFSPHSVAAMLCLIERETVVIPIAPSSEEQCGEFLEIARAEFEIRVETRGDRHADEGLLISRTGLAPDHALYRRLAGAGHPGLVLFSSGSTGEPKGVVHDWTHLLTKYRTRRHCYRTLAFLLFDHIGGLDTLFYSLSNGSCLVLCEDRSPEGVCRLIAEHQVRVLPVAPSFLKLLSISGAYRRHDLSSLAIVTYGAEMMPDTTLARCTEMFPGARLMQKFGTSEVGTLRSQSKSSDSLWVKLGGEGYQTRVVDGMLEIKAESTMLGYLNAQSPMTEDGWFMTGDCVDVDGEYIRFRGRSSDLINVGGRKVYPAEVESVISGIDNVAEVAVFGEANALMGQIVCARVRTTSDEDPKTLNRRIRAACKQSLENYKVPTKIEIADEPLTTARFKLRRGESL